MSFVDHDYFFLGSAGNALEFSIRAVLGLFEDYHFPLSHPGSELLSGSAKVQVSVNQCIFQLTFFDGSLFCHFSLIFRCKLLPTYLDWISNRVTNITTFTAVEELGSLVRGAGCMQAFILFIYLFYCFFLKLRSDISCESWWWLRQ